MLTRAGDRTVGGKKRREVREEARPGRRREGWQESHQGTRKETSRGKKKKEKEKRKKKRAPPSPPGSIPRVGRPSPITERGYTDSGSTTLRSEPGRPSSRLAPAQGLGNLDGGCWKWQSTFANRLSVRGARPGSLVGRFSMPLRGLVPPRGQKAQRRTPAGSTSHTNEGGNTPAMGNDRCERSDERLRGDGKAATQALRASVGGGRRKYRELGSAAGFPS